jgi:polar amino acid transport system substrate-binding protein
MRRYVWLIPILLALSTTIAEAQTDPRILDVVRAGKLRVALFLPQFSKDPATGEVRRDAHITETARGLAKRVGVELQLIELPTPVSAMDCLGADGCDAVFMGNEPSRAGKVDFSPPIFELDYALLVPAGSPIRRTADADRAGVRIAAVRDHASTLSLSRILKHAGLVYADTPEPTFELLRGGRAEAFASVAYALHGYAAKLPGSRVLEERYGFNSLAIAVPKGRSGWLDYVSQFVKEAKESGLARRAVEAGGMRGIQVAPPAGAVR